jgi:hypothetical protein
MLTNRSIIYLSDIKELSKQKEISNQDLFYLRLPKARYLETYIQQQCKKIFDNLQLKYQNIPMQFLQIDNGGEYSSIANKMRKKAEGTVKGASDVIMFIKNKVIFCEFKRIGAPSQIDIKQEQVDFQERMKKDFNCYCIITNNPLYFNSYIEKILMNS